MFKVAESYGSTATEDRVKSLFIAGHSCAPTALSQIKRYQPEAAPAPVPD